MNTFKLTLLIVELNHLYENMRKNYLPYIDTNKQPRKIGGTYYGRTQLFSTVGTQFKKVIGYTSHEYAGHSYYDFAFQVGGVHTPEFSTCKTEFLCEMKNELVELFERHGFVYDNKFYVQDNMRILYVEEVGYGTNFSTYCGLRMYIKDVGSYSEKQINPKWLREQVK